jgi:hypothetical protein
MLQGHTTVVGKRKPKKNGKRDDGEEITGFLFD